MLSTQYLMSQIMYKVKLLTANNRNAASKNGQTLILPSDQADKMSLEYTLLKHQFETVLHCIYTALLSVAPGGIYASQTFLIV